jgi:hypothetical protein
MYVSKSHVSKSAVRTLPWAPLGLVVSIAAAGCGAMPPTPAARSLYVDAEKVVGTGEQLGWVIDQHEVDEALPEVLPSVCQVPEEDRLSLIRWLEARIEAEGGSAEAVYRANGGDLGEVEDLLELERIHMVLMAAERAAGEHCPFWLETDEDFEGIHGTRGFTVIAETNGGGGLILRDGQIALGGGGGGRVLPSIGFSETVALGIGVELGGAAAFEETASGSVSVAVQFMGAIPLLLRIRDGLGVIDLEAAPVFRYVDDAVRTPGFRVAIGYGLSTLRGGGFMPHAILWLGYEFQPPRLDFGAEHSIRLGTRVGIDWNP